MDLRTLLLMAAMSSMMLAVVVYIVSRLVREDEATTWWVRGVTASSVGYLLLILRGAIPDFLSIIVANVLIGWSWPHIYLGFRRYFALTTGIRWDIVAAAVVLATFVPLTYAWPNLHLRITVNSLVLGLAMIGCTWVVFRNIATGLSLLRRYLLVVFASTSVIFIVRGIATPLSPSGGDLLALNDLIQPLTFAWGTFFHIALAGGLPLLLVAKARKDLAESEARLRQTLEHAPNVAVQWYDLQGRVCYWNAASERLYGYGAAEASGRTLDQLIYSPEEADAFRQSLSTIAENGKPIGPAQISIRDRSGKERVVLATIFPIPGNGPEELLFACMDVDITQQKQAERRLGLAMDASKILIWEIDLTTGKLGYDGSAMVGLGLDKSSAPDTLDGWIERLHPDDRDRFSAMVSQALQAGHLRGFDCEYRLHDNAGNYHWLQSVGQAVQHDADGRPLRAAGYSVNIDDRKRAEFELERHRDHLEGLVLERTADLVNAKVAAEAASRAKSVFLANMSHELRTPMNGVMGMIDLARRRMADPNGLDQLDKAKSSAERLLGVINDILDISKIEAERMILEDQPLRIADCVANVTGTLGQQASAKGLPLVIDIPSDLAQARFKGDPLRLGQILTNLVGNAIKFTDRGNVTLRARQVGETPEGQRVRFDVVDTGIGIDSATFPRLFESFEQADNSMTRKYGGTGLGLAISKRLVQLMGGEIGVESNAGNGSTFWFSIPMQRWTPDSTDSAPSSAGLSAEQRLRTAYAGSRVLVAEDEPINREIARFQLENAGLVVDLAQNGQEAVALAKQKHYAVILMDMQMPVMNGVDATKAIRANSLNQATAVLALTANAFDEDRQACLAAGMNDHITKPIDPEKLYEILLGWLKQAGLSRE